MRSQSALNLLNLWLARTPYLLFGMGGLIFLTAISSPLLMSKKLNRLVTVQQETSQVLGPIAIEPQRFGTVRIEVKPDLSPQRWVTYEVQLIDQNDQIVLAGVKNAWRETGTWYEDGESGTWDEADRDAGLICNCVRPSQLRWRFLWLRFRIIAVAR